MLPVFVKGERSVSKLAEIAMGCVGRAVGGIVGRSEGWALVVGGGVSVGSCDGSGQKLLLSLVHIVDLHP